MQEEWLHSGMKLKLQQIKALLDYLPRTASVSITEPINLPKELFTDSGSGTLIKLAIVLLNIKSQIKRHKSILKKLSRHHSVVI